MQRFLFITAQTGAAYDNRQRLVFTIVYPSLGVFTGMYKTGQGLLSCAKVCCLVFKHGAPGEAGIEV